MFNAGVRGKRAKDGVGFLSTAEQFNQKSFLVPTVTSFSITDVSYVPLDNTAVDTAGGEIIVINGSGFAPGATVQVGATTIGSVTFIDQNRLAFTAPALSSGSYTIYVTNSNGGTGILLSGLVYSGLPTYSTTAGTLGTIYETANINTAVVATGDAPITYSVISGTLPSGATLNSNGTITGNAPVDGSSTTYSFTIQASDAQLQDSTRAFTLTISTDVLTWGLANNTVYSLDGGTTMSNVTLSATSSANSNSAVTFAANTLPTGVSLSGNTIFGTPTTEQTVYSTLTATATQTGRTATRFVSWVVSVSDLFFKYNTLAIQGADTTFVDDASTNNFAVTINGDTKPNSFNPYTPGYYSNYFDGTGDYLSSPSITAASGDFTLEGWINGNSTQPQTFATAIYFGGVASTSYELWIQFNHSSNPGKIRFAVSTIVIVPSTSQVSNRWYHVAIVRSGSTATCYIDGVNIGSTTYTSPLGGGALSIGQSPGTSSTAYAGYVSNVRFVNGTAVYTSNFTPSTTPLTAISGTSLLTCQSNRFIDNSTNNFTITVAGNTTVNSFDPFVPNSSYSTYGSGYFDGTGDYLSLSNTISFESANFTVEMWIYPTSLASSMKLYGAWGGYQFWIGTNGRVIWQFGGSNSPDIAALYISANRWVHIAWVRFGNSMLTFIDGVLKDTTSYSGTVNSDVLPVIGKSSDSASDYFYGYMSNLRIVRGTAVYTADFTPPSAPLTAIANTQLLTLQNNQPVNNSTFLDNSTNNFLVTRNGNTTQGTFSPYGGNWSNYFDGSGDYLSVPNNTALNLWVGDFTIEMWVYSNANQGNYTGLVAKGGGAATGWQMVIVSNSVNVEVFGSTLFFSPSTTLPNSQWVHLAIVKSGTNVSLFQNGTRISAITGSSTTYSNTSDNVNIGTERSAGIFFNGYISNIRLVKGTAVYDPTQSSFTPPTTPLTPITNTSLLTCADGRFIDNSINNFTITKGGDTSVQRFSPFNPSSVTPTSYSGYFDGTGDYLSAAGTNLALSTGDFTIECWIYRVQNGRVDGIYTAGRSPSASGGFGVKVADNNKLWWNTNTSYGGGSGATVNAGQWYHIAITRQSSTLKWYINGILDYTSAGFTQDCTNQFAMFGITDDPTYTNMYISNARIIKGTALYTTTFTPSTTPLTTTSQGATESQVSLLTLQSNTFIDNSTYNYPITAFGNTTPTIQNPFGYTSTTTNGYTPSTIGGSAYFDGTGDYLSVANSPVWSSLPGNFTIECWFYLNSVALAQQLIFSQRTSAAGYVPYLIWVTTTTITMYSSSNNGSWNILSGATIASGLTAGQWYHLAFTRSGSTNRIFLNGVQTYTYTNSSSFTNSNTFNLGMAPGETNTALNGYITDARLLNGTALYTSNFVPPSAPLTAVQNSSLLLNMTSAGIYDAAMMTTMETMGDAKLSTAVSKFGGSSMYFDGSGDYLFSPTANVNNLSKFLTSNFTVECWIYPTTSSGDRTIICAVYSWGSGGENYEIELRSGLLFVQFGGVTMTSGTISISANTWTHIALVRSGLTSTTFYVNGVSVATYSSNWTANEDCPLTIGCFNANGGGLDNYWQGYIDDLRITKGYARYTSNFTPPTTTFKIK